MMRFSVPHNGIERYQDTKRCGYEAGDEDESAFHSKYSFARLDNQQDLATVPARPDNSKRLT
jgi:hypothetical protein